MTDNPVEFSSQEGEEIYISKIGFEQPYNLQFDKKVEMHVLTLDVVNKSAIKGLACGLCRIPIKDKYKLYFCEESRIFMCYDCVRDKHLAKTTTKEPEHRDYCVLVELTEVKQ